MRWPWSPKLPEVSSPSRRSGVPARLYTREGCGLCDQLLDMLQSEGLLERLDLVQVDVDGDRALKKRYGLRLPVLEIAGREAFEGTPDPGRVRRQVRHALRSSP